MAVTKWALPVLGGMLLAAACSSEKKGDDDIDGSGGTDGPNIVIDDPNNPGGVYEGGEELLTPEQAQALIDAESTCAGWAAEPEGGPATLMMVIDTIVCRWPVARPTRRSRSGT